jgi:RNA polymerase sigma-70 factor (ECF subfamily)
MSERKTHSSTERPEGGSVSLVERVQRDEPGAWSRLVSYLGPLVWVPCRKYLHSSDVTEDYEDVLQDVLAAVSSHVKEFDRARPGATFRGWVWTITKRKIADFNRKKRAEPQAVGGTTARDRIQQLPEVVELPDGEPSPETVDVILVQQALEAIRGDFSPSTWEAYRLTVVERLSSAEVAARVGTTKQAVRQGNRRVRARLRDELSGLVSLAGADRLYLGPPPSERRAPGTQADDG